MKLPILKTERLVLKPIAEQDCSDIFDLQSLQQTTKYNTSKAPKDIDETKIFLKNWMEEKRQRNAKTAYFFGEFDS